MTGPGPLIKLTIEGVRGIAEFDCDPDGNDLALDGDNGVGKSSATDAIAWALGEDVDGEIVKNGADRASVELRWRATDGTVLDIRARQAKGGKRALTIKSGKDTKGSPATLLAGERGSVSRRTFSSLPAKDQIAIVKRLAPGLDTTDLDTKRAALYEARTAIGHVGKAYGDPGEALPMPTDIGEEWAIVDAVDVAEIAEKKAPMLREIAANDAKRQAAKREADEARTAHKASADADRAVEAAQRALDAAKRTAEAAQAKSDELAQAVADNESDLAALADPNPSSIDAEIAAAREKNAAVRAEAEAHNRAVRERQKQADDVARANAERDRKVAAIEAERAKYAAHTKQIDAIDAEKLKRITDAAGALPITGLAISGGIVTLDDGTHGPVEARIGVLNDAACMELDVRMAAAQGHRLVVLRNAERLGKAARDRINVLAREHKIQTVREVRSDGEKLTAEVIEDGE